MAALKAMLIRAAQIGDQLRCDVRITGDRIMAIAPHIPPDADEIVIEAGGGSLLPGLHDHHLHLRALAARQDSLPCGPPHCCNAEDLKARLNAVASESGWLRAVDYHESVAGDIDRHWLDAVIPNRAVRLQHRSGRLWVFNSAALAQLAPEADAPLERVNGKLTGRLYDADHWLRTRLPPSSRSLAPTSQYLAQMGITAITDTTHTNTVQEYASLVAASERGELLQRVQIMGDESLTAMPASRWLRPDAYKVHLHDADLPDWDELLAAIRRCHAAQRNCAFHCVTRGELVYALAALSETGVRVGDRIEHAGVVSPDSLAEIQRLGLIVVTQPHFIAERGDHYLRDVDPDDQPWLYRLRGVLDAHIPLLGSSDAPFGAANPWAAMQAAVDRRTATGVTMTPAERLSPEQALALYTGELVEGKYCPRTVMVGAVADLCLLRQPWQVIRGNLTTAEVMLTVRAGDILYRRAP